MQPSDFAEILTVLADHKVDLVVVGGVAATLQGAPITTFDLDIVHSREEVNLDRLTAALRELEAWYREKPDVRNYLPSCFDLPEKIAKRCRTFRDSRP